MTIAFGGLQRKDGAHLWFQKEAFEISILENNSHGNSYSLSPHISAKDV